MIWETRREEEGLLTVPGGVGSCRAGGGSKNQTLQYIDTIRSRDKHAYCKEDYRTHDNDIAAEFKIPTLNELSETVSGFMLIASVVIINIIKSIQNVHCQNVSAASMPRMWRSPEGDPFGLISGLRGGVDIDYNWGAIKRLQ